MKGRGQSPKASQVCRATVAIAAFAISSASSLCLAQDLAQASPVLPIAAPTLLLTKAASTKTSPPASAVVNGTVTDSTGALIPGARVEIDSLTPQDSRTVQAGNDGTFQLTALKPGVTYVVHVGTEGAAPWTSDPIILQPEQIVTLNNIRLKLGTTDSITVVASRSDVATAQVQLETQQRVFGVLPNFYTVYDGAHTVPLTAKLKFQLATRTAFNPVTIAGVAFMAGVKQASRTPNYQLGAKGYGERFGSTAATGISDIMIGGAVLPSLLHQDPRYFYQGTGSTRSRLLHALSAAVVAHGDNGRSQFNASSIGGDLAASGLQMAYYPQSNRSVSVVFGQFAVATAERTLNSVLQEFLFPRLTSRAKFHAE